MSNDLIQMYLHGIQRVSPGKHLNETPSHSLGETETRQAKALTAVQRRHGIYTEDHGQRTRWVQIGAPQQESQNEMWMAGISMSTFSCTDSLWSPERADDTY